jgi:hypothetical protein
MQYGRPVRPRRSISRAVMTFAFKYRRGCIYYHNHGCRKIGKLVNGCPRDCKYFKQMKI